MGTTVYGRLSEGIYEVRGVTKPYFIVFDGTNEPKTLYRHKEDALYECIKLRKIGKSAGVLFVDTWSTGFVEPVAPAIHDHYVPVNFTII